MSKNHEYFCTLGFRSSVAVICALISAWEKLKFAATRKYHTAQFDPGQNIHLIFKAVK